MNIVFFDLEPWEQERIQEALPGHNLTLYEEGLTAENLSRAHDAEVLGLFIYSPVNSETLKRLPKLKLIVTCSTGFDHINLEACKAAGVTVCNVPTYGENTVAEHTFGLILNLTRKIHKAYLNTTQGDFGHEGLRGIDLKGRTIGIVGYGHIGQHVARIAEGFEMQVLIHDPARAESIPYDDLLQQSDVISFHCPLLDSTHHLFNQKSLERCKKGVYIINTARGPIIKTEALLEGLDSGVIAGAGLDVLEEERCIIREEKEVLSPHFDPNCMRITLENHVLLHHPKVIITPHNAFNSEEALRRIIDTSVQNILSFEKGEKQNVVT